MVKYVWLIYFQFTSGQLYTFTYIYIHLNILLLETVKFVVFLFFVVVLYAELLDQFLLLL